MASGAGLRIVIALLRAAPARAACTIQVLFNCQILHGTDRSFSNDTVALHEQYDDGTAVCVICLCLSRTTNASRAIYKVLHSNRLLQLWGPVANLHCTMVDASIDRAKHPCMTQGTEDYLLAVCHCRMTVAINRILLQYERPKQVTEGAHTQAVEQHKPYKADVGNETLLSHTL